MMKLVCICFATYVFSQVKFSYIDSHLQQISSCELENFTHLVRSFTIHREMLFYSIVFCSVFLRNKIVVSNTVFHAKWHASIFLLYNSFLEVLGGAKYENILKKKHVNFQISISCFDCYISKSPLNVQKRSNNVKSTSK